MENTIFLSICLDASQSLCPGLQESERPGVQVLPHFPSENNDIPSLLIAPVSTQFRKVHSNRFFELNNVSNASYSQREIYRRMPISKII